MENGVRRKSQSLAVSALGFFLPAPCSLGSQGTILETGSLQAPVPPGPTPRTRAQAFVPLGKPSTTALDLEASGCDTQLVAVMGSGLICTS